MLNAALYRNIPFDVRRAFAPVSLIGLIPNIVVVSPRLPAATLRELVELVRREPGRRTYASSGPGTITHLSGHMLAEAAGGAMVHVPYRGSGPANADLVAGRVDVMVDTISSTIPFVRNGQMRALAVGSKTRSAALPEVPTAAEAGLPGYESTNWHALFVAAGTPAPLVARLEAGGARRRRLARDQPPPGRGRCRSARHHRGRARNLLGRRDEALAPHRPRLRRDGGVTRDPALIGAAAMQTRTATCACGNLRGRAGADIALQLHAMPEAPREHLQRARLLRSPTGDDRRGMQAVSTLLGVAAGAFADPAFPPPQVVVWTEQKNHWVALPAGVPSRPKQR